MTLVTPADAKGPVPVMMMFGGRGLPQFAPPPAAAAGRGGPGGPGGFGPPPGSDPPATRTADRRRLGLRVRSIRAAFRRTTARV